MSGLKLNALKVLLRTAKPWRWMIERRSVQVAGRTLHPQAQLLRSMMSRNPQPPMSSLTPVEFRYQTKAVDEIFLGDRPSMASVNHRVIPTAAGPLLSRHYVPRSQSGAMLLYFHGGGFVVGDLDSHDIICRFLADRAGLQVLSVDYRLAPEHRFPAAVDDALGSYEYVHEHADIFGIDPNRIAVGGDSSGGNLATVIAHEMVREKRPGPALQVLLYPVLDLSQKSESYRLFGTGYALTEDHIDWGIQQYLTEEKEMVDPRVSPLLSESFDGLPPAIITTAGFDILHDEGADYAALLDEAGVDVEYHCCEGMMHGYGRFLSVMDPAREVMEAVADSIKRRLS